MEQGIGQGEEEKKDGACSGYAACPAPLVALLPGAEAGRVARRLALICGQQGQETPLDRA